MSIYRGNKLIAAGGRDVNPDSILAGTNISVEATLDDKCVTISTCDCVCFTEATTDTAAVNCNLTLCGCLLDSNGCCYLQNTVSSTECCAKMETMTEVAYQALAVKDPATYYFTTGTGGGVYKGTDRIATNDCSCNFTVQNCLQACDACVTCIHATQKMVIPMTPPATTTVGAMWLTV